MSNPMEQYIDVLNHSPFFTGMTDQEILSILHCVDGRIISRQKEEYILHAGETTSVMGLVLSGSALVLQDDLWGYRNIMSRCQAGDFFGEPYAANPGTRMNVSVVADTDCQILLLNISRLLTTCATTCDHHNRLIRNLVSVLAQKILVFNEKITHMSRRSTRDKLLSYLSAESIRQGSLSFDIPYNRQQLADFLCVERAAMTVELSKLQKEGFLETKRSHFILKELPE